MCTRPDVAAEDNDAKDGNTTRETWSDNPPNLNADEVDVGAEDEKHGEGNANHPGRRGRARELNVDMLKHQNQKMAFDPQLIPFMDLDEQDTDLLSKAVVRVNARKKGITKEGFLDRAFALSEETADQSKNKEKGKAKETEGVESGHPRKLKWETEYFVLHHFVLQFGVSKPGTTRQALEGEFVGANILPLMNIETMELVKGERRGNGGRIVLGLKSSDGSEQKTIILRCSYGKHIGSWLKALNESKELFDQVADEI